VTVYPISTRVVIDGVQAYDDGDSFLAGLPTIVDGLSFTWGRQTNVDQPDPGTCTFTLHEELFGTVTPMLDAINVDQSVKVWVDITQPDSTVTSVLTWAGTVTEVNGAAVGYSAFQVAVTAADAAAPLADETIKDAPWIVQPVQTRVNRILQLANVRPCFADASADGRHPRMDGDECGDRLDHPRVRPDANRVRVAIGHDPNPARR
jgi:hypothetical protein